EGYDRCRIVVTRDLANRYCLYMHHIRLHLEARHECPYSEMAPLVSRVIRIAGEAPDRWANEEVALAAEERRKHGTNISSSAVRPTAAFIRTLADKIG
ncbi:hypothetical protein PMAYCL1PPCAC_31565, partial [Pristionchus mayeri]